MKRRAFLKFLGVSPVAGKMAAEKMAMELADVSIHPSSGLNVVSDLGNGLSVERIKQERKPISWLQDFFRKGFPEWLKEKARNESDHVHSIMPDIASLRSVSLSGKYAMQRRFQYEKALEKLKKIGSNNYWDERDKFGKETGWWL